MRGIVNSIMDAKQKPRYVRGLLWFVGAIAGVYRPILAFDDFYPVVVRVFDEGDVAHRAVFRAFLVGDVILVKPADGCVEIRHADADVAEAARFAVAVVVVEGGSVSVPQLWVSSRMPLCRAIQARRASSSSAAASVPFRSTLPSVGVSRQERMFISVVLPEPLEPMMATNSPRATAMFTSSSAVTVPKRL